MKPIAICQNKRIFNHSGSWAPRFIEYCEENGIPYEIVDGYSNDIVQHLSKYSALVWYYNNYVISDILEARNILKIASDMGLVTFPHPDMNWHFDDKIAEKYAFEAVGAKIPNSWVFYLEEDCIDWIENQAAFPIVAKLRCGSGSNNVKLLRNKSEAKQYARRMFSKGFCPSPTIVYKAYSKLQSTRSIRTAIQRIRKIPEFLNTRRHAKMMPYEKGYCYFQEYIPNNGYDLKVAVINGKLTFCARHVRANDFRASGGGDCYYDRSLLTNQIINSAFDIAMKLKLLIAQQAKVK